MVLLQILRTFEYAIINLHAIMTIPSLVAEFHRDQRIFAYDNGCRKLSNTLICIKHKWDVIFVMQF